jgi:hypothetical protein
MLQPMQPPAIQAALDNLVETVRTSLMAEFLELLRNGKPPSAKLGRKSGRVARTAGGRRSAEGVEQVGQQIVSFLKKNPDVRAEQIAAGIGSSTKELALPIKKLLADKQVAKKGQRRGTTYRAR